MVIQDFTLKDEKKMQCPWLLDSGCTNNPSCCLCPYLYPSWLLSHWQLSLFILGNNMCDPPVIAAWVYQQNCPPNFQAFISLYSYIWLQSDLIPSASLQLPISLPQTVEQPQPLMKKTLRTTSGFSMGAHGSSPKASKNKFWTGVSSVS